MEYIRFGPTGMKVSRICLGCMSYGYGGPNAHWQWALDEETSRPFIKQALESGINFLTLPMSTQTAAVKRLWVKPCASLLLRGMRW